MLVFEGVTLLLWLTCWLKRLRHESEGKWFAFVLGPCRSWEAHCQRVSALPTRRLLSATPAALVPAMSCHRGAHHESQGVLQHTENMTGTSGPHCEIHTRSMLKVINYLQTKQLVSQLSATLSWVSTYVKYDWWTKWDFPHKPTWLNQECFFSVLDKMTTPIFPYNSFKCCPQDEPPRHSGTVDGSAFHASKYS